MSDGAADSDLTVLHATCVAYAGAGVLILGASGRGKSRLALQMIALGADLVADDRTTVRVAHVKDRPALIADAPDTLRGLIEARGVGLLRAQAYGPCPLALVVDLDRNETDRLPPMRETVLSGITLPVLHMVDSAAFPAAILQYVRHGRGA